jgi:hypothetical protein
MKAMINSTMKLLAAALLVSTAAASAAGDYRYYDYKVGVANTKGDSLAMALQQLPAGAKIEKVNFNGSATRQFVKGVGYIQTSGSHKCKVDYSR